MADEPANKLLRMKSMNPKRTVPPAVANKPKGTTPLWISGQLPVIQRGGVGTPRGAKRRDQRVEWDVAKAEGAGKGAASPAAWGA